MVDFVGSEQTILVRGTGSSIGGAFSALHCPHRERCHTTFRKFPRMIQSKMKSMHQSNLTADFTGLVVVKSQCLRAIANGLSLHFNTGHSNDF